VYDASGCGAQGREHLAVLGPATRLLLGEDEPSVREDVVLALGAFESDGVETLLG
jgi:hypothetical protein